MAKQSYHISTQREALNLEVIYRFLTQSYWSPGIPKSVVKKAIDHSLCFGAFDMKGNQVGFARAITDKATFAYLADVFVLPEHRGRGISNMIMEAYTAHPDLKDLRRHILATKDAHKLYEKFGFTAIDHPEILMQKHDPEVYNKMNYEGKS